MPSEMFTIGAMSAPPSPARKEPSTKVNAKTHPVLIPTAPTISPSTAAARAIFPRFVLLMTSQRKTAMHGPTRRRKRLYHGSGSPKISADPWKKAGTVTERYSGPQTIFTRSPRMSAKEKVRSRSIRCSRS